MCGPIVNLTQHAAIAVALNIHVSSVKSHLATLMAKLGRKNRTGLALWAAANFGAAGADGLGQPMPPLAADALTTAVQQLMTVHAGDAGHAVYATMFRAVLEQLASKCGAATTLIELRRIIAVAREHSTKIVCDPAVKSLTGRGNYNSPNAVALRDVVQLLAEKFAGPFGWQPTLSVMLDAMVARSLTDWEGYPNLTAAVLNNLLVEREQAVAGLLHAD